MTRDAVGIPSSFASASSSFFLSFFYFSFASSAESLIRYLLYLTWVGYLRASRPWHVKRACQCQSPLGHSISWAALASVLAFHPSFTHFGPKIVMAVLCCHDAGGAWWPPAQLLAVQAALSSTTSGRIGS
ncbi:uncharacterized protein LY79DRAFT_537290 [Colletotrichum navitas]|uniref:Uncharacterized protein n=1 Tax=Colletotrichum navitas TaxID=681940 RepID=A0AAD8QD88_9PEZI|nr:uncharacterized protein LY79DRAFT_537290 [Colletotrichum navitas]KAK1599188.1 hypothetical protein LY79DRAFT_537290 [Colletotrichum navitas]